MTGLKNFLLTILQAALWLAFAACTLLSPDKENSQNSSKEIIARYKNEYLLLSDIAESLTSAETRADSLEIINRMAANWLKNKVLMDKALLNLGDDVKRFEKQIEDYRRDLIIHAYEQAYVSQNLDTNITDEELREFYNNHKNIFQLRENIVVADYAIFPSSTPKINEIKKIFFNARSKKEETLLGESALKYARIYSRGDTSWVNFTEIVKIIPFATENLLNTGYSRQLIFEDENFTYLLNIKQVMKKDAPAPLEYVVESIRNSILNIRKQALLQSLEENLVKQSLNQKQAEIFVTP
ncbi:hypothetical protein [Schleiferia thermophila]|jgi:hypothetical protein|uniref:Peptidyl-prolyl cis-trans isomerase n=1 Tax=Schleiferia thermophila TaxID=884107 RepID=A0A369A9T8_9FLAO|nr:hypothetical protein [Schleiferia thermophila]RCX04857.1 hypothetical protein DES35_101127 [Schleiferia thermophila]GCD79617.1 hypothetical protein JCM30197_08640 [Schleiferia thermophila]